MKREEAFSNAIGVLVYTEAKKLGYIRNIMCNDYEVSLTIHFHKPSEEVYEAKKDIYLLLVDGTTIEVNIYTNRDYDTLEITWNID